MDEAQRSYWGKAKVGGGRLSALAISIPGGLVIGVVGALLARLAGLTGPHPMLGLVVFVLCLTVPGIGLVYALVVDRDTIRGAAARPEESVERLWYERASAAAFSDLQVLLAVAVVAAIFLGSVVPAGVVLAIVLGVSFLTFGFRYLLVRRQG